MQPLGLVQHSIPLCRYVPVLRMDGCMWQNTQTSWDAPLLRIVPVL